MMEIVLPWFRSEALPSRSEIAEAAFAGTVAHTPRQIRTFERVACLRAAGHPRAPGADALAIDSSRAYLDHTLSRIEKGAPDAMLFVLGSKATAAEMALAVTDEAMRACGAPHSAATQRRAELSRRARGFDHGAHTDALYDFIGKAVAGLRYF